MRLQHRLGCACVRGVRQQGVQAVTEVILGEVLQEPGAAANPHGRGACPIAEHPHHRLTKTRPILRID